MEQEISRTLSENAVAQPVVETPAEGDAPLPVAAEGATEGGGPENKKYLKPKDYIGFAGAMACNGAVTGLMQGYLLAYCLTQLSAKYAAYLSLIFLLVKIWDGINDPIMGTIIDRTRTRWGKMRPYIMFAAIPFGLMTIFMFSIPANIHDAWKLVWIAFGYVAWDVLSTLIDVPLQGLFTVVTPNNQERTNVITIVRMVGSVAEQAALVVTTVLIWLKKNTSLGFGAGGEFTWAAVILGVVAGVAMVLCVRFGIKERLVTKQDPPKVLDSFRYLFKNKPLFILILSNLLTFFRNLVSASILYVVSCVFFKSELQIIFSLPGAIASILGMSLAPFMRKKFDSKSIFIIATIAHSAALAVVFGVGFAILSAGNTTAAMYTVAALMFVAMLPVGLLNTVPSLMVTDCIDYMEWKTGTRAEGMAFSLMTLRNKIGSGLKDGVLILLLVVIFGFKGYGAENDVFPDQEWSTRVGIFCTYSIIPAVFNLVSIIPMLFYKLDGKTVAKINAELAERRKSNSSMEIIE